MQKFTYDLLNETNWDEGFGFDNIKTKKIYTCDVIYDNTLPVFSIA